MTRAEALATLEKLTPVDVITVFKTYGDEHLSDGYGWEKADAGLDEVLAELREDERLPRYVSNDFAYIEYPRTGGIRL